jgi:hypothetical protein
MAEETFVGYQDVGEKGFIRWSLGYTMEPIIECFLAIPEDRRYGPVAEKLPAPCRILGHIALNEELLIGGFAQGIRKRRCPFAQRLFDVRRSPTEEELREGVPDSEQLVAYWRDVRLDTLRYLDSLSADDLRHRPAQSILSDGEPNRDNPIRELFLMAIQHQNCHWGELRAIGKILGAKMRW